MAETQPIQKSSKVRDPKGLAGYVISILTFGMIFFQFYTAYMGVTLPPFREGIHLIFGLALVFLV